MTTKVIVTNPLTNKYSVEIKVSQKEGVSVDYGVLKPGSSMDVYVYEGRTVLIEEKRDG